MATAGPQLKVWSRDDYYRAAQHVELIDGAILMMSPMKAGHATALLLTTNALRKVFGDAFCIRVQLPPCCW